MNQQERHDELKANFNDVAHWLGEVHKTLDGNLTEKRTLDSALAMCKLAMESMCRLFEGLETEQELSNPSAETIVITDAQTKDALAQLCERTGASKDEILKAGLGTLMMTSNSIARQLSAPGGSPAGQALAEYLRNRLGDN